MQGEPFGTASRDGKRSRPLTTAIVGGIIGTLVATVIITLAAAGSVKPSSSKLADHDVSAPSEQIGRAAVRSALRHSESAALLRGARWRAIQHRWHRAPPCAAACVATIFYRYESDTLVETFTTPEGDLLDVEQSKGQPPVSPEEQVHAHRLAEADRAVRKSLSGDPHVHGATAYSLYPDHGICTRHRCASVVFMLDGLASSGVGRQLQVLVDLSTDTIVDRLYQRCSDACGVGW